MTTYTPDNPPRVNGIPAPPCPKGDACGICGTGGIMLGTLLPYRCPHCEAHLGRSGVCLNKCGLTGAGYREMDQGLRRAATLTAIDSSRRDGR